MSKTKDSQKAALNSKDERISAQPPQSHHLGRCEEKSNFHGLFSIQDFSEPPVPFALQMKLECQDENNSQQNHNGRGTPEHTALRAQQLMEMKGGQSLQSGDYELVGALFYTAQWYGNLIAGETKAGSQKPCQSSFPSAISCEHPSRDCVESSDLQKVPEPQLRQRKVPKLFFRLIRSFWKSDAKNLTASRRESGGGAYEYPTEKVQPLIKLYDGKIAWRKTKQYGVYLLLGLAALSLPIVLYKRGIFVLSSKDLKRKN